MAQNVSDTPADQVIRLEEETRPSLAVQIPPASMSPPVLRRGIVDRPGVLDRIAEASDAAIVTIVAPPGYGKTTLLAAFAARDPRPVAWVTLNEFDEDPAMLLTHVAASLDAAMKVDPAIFSALATVHTTYRASALRSLVASLSSAPDPFVLAIDDCHLLNDADTSSYILETVANNLPVGSQIVFAGRAEPSIPLARLRAEGKVATLDTADLRLDHVEARELLGAVGYEPTDSDLADLVVRTEGWAAGLYLAARASTDQGATVGGVFHADDHLLADYMRSEVIGRLPQDERDFMVRTSVLDQLSGPFCDVVLGRAGSSEMLAALGASNLFVVPLDRERHWYRYHFLLRAALQHELEREEGPEGISELLLRASGWCEENELLDLAVEYAERAGASARVGEIIQRRGMRAYAMGRLDALRSWFTWLEGASSVDGATAVLGAWFELEAGRAATASTWMQVAESAPQDTLLTDGSALRAWIRTVQAITCMDGQDMLTLANEARDSLSPRSQLRPAAVLMAGFAHMMEGRFEEADADFSDAVELGIGSGGTGSVAAALSLRAMIALRQGRQSDADTFVEAAVKVLREARLQDYANAAMVHAVRARLAVSAGDMARAKESIGAVDALSPLLTRAVVSRSVIVQLELARTHLALGDATAAARCTHEARMLLRETTHFDQAQSDLDQLSEMVETLRTTMPDGEGYLTPAELRLFPFLATQLSFREIAEELYLSIHTVKAEVTAIYRKLGVSSRTQAVERARSVGLLPTES